MMVGEFVAERVLYARTSGLLGDLTFCCIGSGRLMVWFWSR
jgi:hypothetical protein